jgi:hypothetical protein
MLNKSIFIYLEGTYDRVSTLIQMAKKYHYLCFTHERNYKKCCENEKVKCQIVPRGRRFKREIRKLNPSVIITRSDFYYGEQFWLATHYKTVVVEEGFDFKDIKEIQDEFRILYEHSGLLEKICLPIFKILSLVPVHPKLTSFTPYPIISRSFLKALFDRFYFGMKNKLVLPGAYTNKYCISHYKNKEFYSFFGIDKSKIEVTGVPIFDAIPKLINEWNERGKIIKHDLLYIGQPWAQEGVKKFYKILFPDLVSLAKKYSLCVKLHPREGMEEFKYFEDYPHIDIIPHTPTFSLEDNIRLILESKYIIGTGSSLINFAILLNKPVIIYNFIFQDMQTRYEMLGFKFCTTSFKGVVQAIQDCEEKNDRYYEQMEAQTKCRSTVIIDGKACDRINNVVNSIAIN